MDEKRAFVGSFNFDPRSAKYNTELGFVIESPKMARGINEHFDEDLRESAYELRLDPDGKLLWIEHRRGLTFQHDSEPDIGMFQRVFVRVLSWLPIDWLL